MKSLRDGFDTILQGLRGIRSTVRPYLLLALGLVVGFDLGLRVHRYIDGHPLDWVSISVVYVPVLLALTIDWIAESQSKRLDQMET